MKAKRLNLRERNLQPVEEPVEEIEEATPPEPDPELVSWSDSAAARGFPDLDYGEGKTAEEERLAGQRVLAYLAFMLLLITVAAGLGILILLLR